MKIVSVNVGLPREVEWRGETIETAIFKSPVATRVAVRRLNLDGDRQADLTVHGGAEKAVYAYPSEHFPRWREELPGVAFDPAAFGENLTTEGLDETTVHIGDRFLAGTAELIVTQPRMPCYKLLMKFDRLDMGKRMLATGRTGFYFALTREGDVAAGDAITLVARDPEAISVADVASLYRGRRDRALLERVARLESLPMSWRSWFAEKLR